MQKIYAFTQGLPLRQLAQAALSLPDTDARRHAAHALAAGQALPKPPSSQAEPSSLASRQRKAALAERAARVAELVWQLALIPALALGARWALGPAPLLSDSLSEPAISFLSAAGFLGIAATLSVELSVWACRQLDLDEDALAASPAQLNALIERARPALALLNSLDDPLSRPSFGMIVAGMGEASSGEALSGARLSDVARVETYTEREWAPKRFGLLDGDAVCHFHNGERSTSMAMGSQGLARLAIDLSFAIERAAELGLEPDPLGREVERRSRERLAKRGFLRSLL